MILNTLSKKLYMTKMTPPQIITAICCVLGSAIRGTFSANEMVAKDRRPSEIFVREGPYLEMEKLTHSGYDLSFQTVLIRKPSSKVADTTSPIPSNVWNLSDVIKHMATCEEKNSYQAYSCPEVAILNDGQQVRSSNT